MAITKLAIINGALLKVGALRLDALNEANTKARVAADAYDLTVEGTFDLPYEWKFARARAQLTQLPTPPDFGFAYQYGLPTGCRRILSMVDTAGDDVRYKWRREVVVVSGQDTPVLLTDGDTCRIRYIRLIANPAFWPGWFRELVILKLAREMTEPVVGDKVKYNMLVTEYRMALEDARAANAAEDDDVDANGRSWDTGNNDVLEAAEGFTAYDQERQQAIDASLS